MDPAGGDVGLLQDVEPFGGGTAAQAFRAHLEIGAHIGEPRLDRAEAGIALQFRPADRVEQREGLGVGVGGHADIAVLGGDGLAQRIEHAQVAARAARRHEGEIAHVLGEHEGGDVLEHRHLDRLAFSGAIALEQRGDDALGRDQPDDVVGEHHRHEARLAERALVGVGDAGEALDDGVVGGAVAVASGAAEPHQVAHDEPRIAAAQAFRIEPEPAERRRPHIGDEHVRGGKQPVQRLAAFLALEVERQRALVAVEVRELAGQLARVRLAAERAQEIAAGRLDLDDVRAVVGEIERRRRSHHDGGEVDDADARERAAHIPPPMFRPAAFLAAAHAASVTSTR